MARHTDTRDCIVFQFKNPGVVFDYANETYGKLRIVASADSAWREPRHWHLTKRACESITCTEVRVAFYSMPNALMSGSQSGGPGTSARFHPSEPHGWYSRFND